MKLLVIVGFLGSGKTTVLMHCIQALGDKGLHVAVIENEIGAVGVDDLVLRESGLPVREIYAGCICCSLRIDLVTTLLDLEREHEPDVVILEPSGVAGPNQVLDALKGYGGEIEGVTVVALLDAQRFHAIQDLSMPIINDAITAADIVLLNKTDMVTPGEADALGQRIHAERDDVKIMQVSALHNTGIPHFLEELTDSMTACAAPTLSTDTPAPSGNPMPGAVACAEEINITLPAPCPGDALGQRLAKALTAFIDALRDAGCTMIGHVKAVIRGPKIGFLLLSVTDFDTAPHSKGRLANRVSEATLRVNAIVFGVKKEQIGALLRETLGAIGGPS